VDSRSTSPGRRRGRSTNGSTPTAASRCSRHEVFSEVARANGKVATGVDRENFVNDQQGHYVFTGSWIFFMPDGSHSQNAGRIQNHV
jgi:hypothetical protein